MNPIEAKFIERNKSRFMTAGFPTVDASVDVLLALQSGGVDVIELGVPFSDPLADGKTIQYSTQIALKNGVDMDGCFDILERARSRGLAVPVIMMGYLNPFIQYGIQPWLKRCRETGVHGVILVDFPVEEATEWISECRKNNISYIPLIAPTSTDARVASLCSQGSGFVYVISALGVTGTRDTLNFSLPSLIERVRKHTDLPLAVGFGITTPEHFKAVSEISEGVVIGSKLIQILQTEGISGLTDFCKHVSSQNHFVQPPASLAESSHASIQSDLNHSFGAFGGRFAPETLIYALENLEASFKEAVSDPEFWKEFRSYYPFVNRPSPLQFAHNLTLFCKSSARIWLKREDLNHTGSHKINNALGQVLLAKRLGKTRIIAETGAGQHGVATATVCAHFNIQCVVYMGKTDTERQALNVFRMKLLGAQVVAVERTDGSGEGTLKDAINEAMRDWVSNVKNTHYLVGSAIGPHPFPTIVKEFQSVIGRELKQQFMELNERNPDVLIACVGGGSNAIGLFAPFVNEKRRDGSLVKLIGVEAGGIATGKHSAPLTAGTPGVLHGCKTYLMQTKDGQIAETHSISAGLDYPGVGPEHAYMKDSKRAEYTAVTDKQALEGFIRLSQLEGIIPALETSHAVYHAIEHAKLEMNECDIVICVSGRGDKDVEQVQKLLQKYDMKIN